MLGEAAFQLCQRVGLEISQDALNGAFRVRAFVRVEVVCGQDIPHGGRLPGPIRQIIAWNRDGVGQAPGAEAGTLMAQGKGQISAET